MPKTVITQQTGVASRPPDLEHAFKRSDHPNQLQMKRPFLSCAVLNPWISQDFHVFPRSPANRHEPWFTIYLARRHRRLLTWRGWFGGGSRALDDIIEVALQGIAKPTPTVCLGTYCLVSQVSLFNYFSILHKLQEPYFENYKKILLEQRPQIKYNGRQSRRYVYLPQLHISALILLSRHIGRCHQYSRKGRWW